MRTKLMKSMFVTGLLCAITLLPAIARADVVDDGGFFSPEAVAAANDALRAVEKKTGHTVRIETHATVPDGKAGAVSKMTGPNREKFFSNWLHDRAEAVKSRGLIVLICKEPAHLRLWVATPLQNAGLDAIQARQIQAQLLAGFKAHEYDKTLKESVTQITTVLEGLSVAKSSEVAPAAPVHHPTNQQPQPHHQQPRANSVGFGGLFTVLAIVLIGVLVFSWITRMFSGASGYAQNPSGYGPGYGPAPGYGGGGFMRGLAGGIFGAMAGNWLYDQFSGHRTYGGDSWTNTDSTYSGSDGGSSISDSGFSGGTDFGGGDFGGGDFGGGGGNCEVDCSGAKVVVNRSLGFVIRDRNELSCLG